MRLQNRQLKIKIGKDSVIMQNIKSVENLDQFKQYLLAQNGKIVQTQHWTMAQICEHCAQTIYCSMQGYPSLKPLWFRRSIGALILKIFFVRSKMKHNLQAPLVGAKPIEVKGQSAFEVLLESIDQFQAYQGELQPHFIFGQMNHADYDRYFTLNLKDHFSEVKFS